MNRRGQLSEDEQARFLAHPKIDEIAAHDRQSICRAVSESAELDDVAAALRKERAKA